MPSNAYRRPLTASALAAVVALTGCSGGQDGLDALPPAADQGAESGSGPVGVSPGGVTTRIDAPAESTEEQYAQSCMAAKQWMAARGGDPGSLVEPYLKEIQASAASGPVTFGTTWAQLSEPQRSAVIIAVRAAADEGC